MALDMGADYLGFVLYRKSPRAMTPLQLAQLLDRLALPCRAVAVFVNAPLGEVEQVAADCGLHAAQLHGDERAADFAATAVRLWRALRCAAGGWSPAPEDWPAERFVADAAEAGMYGGTGKQADWATAAALAARRPVLLAGGLTVENVAEAVRAVRPLGVDVSSGVEAAPGKKDPVKVKDFIKQAKAAGGS